MPLPVHTSLGPGVDPYVDLAADNSANADTRLRNIFLDRFADARLWPIMAHRLPLLKFLAEAIQQWERWPSRIALDIKAEKRGHPDVHFHIHQPAARHVDRLVVTYRGSSDEDICGVHLCHEGTDHPGPQDLREAPNGFFEAIAAGLTMVAPDLWPCGSAAHSMTAGQQLRSEMTRWLRHGTGRNLPVPNGLNWTCWPASGGDIGTAGQHIIPFKPLSLRSSTHPFDFTQLISSPKTGVGTAPATEAEAKSLIHDLAALRWNAELLPLLLHAALRVPSAVTPGLHLGHFVLVDKQGRQSRFGDTNMSGFPPDIGQITVSGPDDNPRFSMLIKHGKARLREAADHLETLAGLPGLLTCVHRLWGDAGAPTRSSSGHEVLPPGVDTLHRAFTNTLSDHLNFVRLCMTLHRQWPDAPDHGFMLRLCMEGNTLTLEGQQVMEPALITRRLDTYADIKALKHFQFPPGQRRQQMFKEGYPLLRAHQFLSPCGLTPMIANHIDSKTGSQLRAAIQSEGTRLFYLYRSWHRVCQYIGVGPNRLCGLVPKELLQQHRSAAEALLLDTMFQPLAGSPSTSASDTQQGGGVALDDGPPAKRRRE